MQKVVGSSPIIRFWKAPQVRGFRLLGSKRSDRVAAKWLHSSHHPRSLRRKIELCTSHLSATASGKSPPADIILATLESNCSRRRAPADRLDDRTAGVVVPLVFGVACRSSPARKGLLGNRGQSPRTLDTTSDGGPLPASRNGWGAGAEAAPESRPRAHFVVPSGGTNGRNLDAPRRDQLVVADDAGACDDDREADDTAASAARRWHCCGSGAAQN